MRALTYAMDKPIYCSVDRPTDVHTYKKATGLKDTQADKQTNEQTDWHTHTNGLTKSIFYYTLTQVESVSIQAQYFGRWFTLRVMSYISQP